MDKFQISDRFFNSRLILGTGKYPSGKSLYQSILKSDTEVVTVALRRVDFEKTDDDILSYIPSGILLLPNTSGARNAEEAVRLSLLAASALNHKWVKLEVTPEPSHLLPDPVETLKAAEILVKKGFKVMPYINADPVLAKKLEDIGVVSVMPLGSPIGSNKGIRTIDQIKIIIKNATVPVIIDAGLGRPSDSAIAMEIGADAVLVNTAISISQTPSEMAYAFKLCTEAGRNAYLNGLPIIQDGAIASSPLTGFLRDDILI